MSRVLLVSSKHGGPYINLSYSGSSLPECQMDIAWPQVRHAKHFTSRILEELRGHLSGNCPFLECSLFGLSDASLLSQLFIGDFKKQANERRRKKFNKETAKKHPPGITVNPVSWESGGHV